MDEKLSPDTPKEEETTGALKEFLDEKETDKETDKEVTVESPVPEEDEKVDDTPTPEGKPSTDDSSVKETQPEVPLEEVVEEVKKQTRDEVKSEVLKSLGITKEEKKEAEESGFKFAWEARGEDAPASWIENADETLRYQEFKKAEQDKVLKEQERVSLADTEARRATVNAEWDSQLDYLRAEGLIPEIDKKIAQKLKDGKILTAEEKTDAGLKAQGDIFGTMWQIAQEREAQGLQPIADVVHVFNRYYKTKQAPMTGKKAPVSGGSIPISGKEDEVTYDELHSKEFEDLIKN